MINKRKRHLLKPRADIEWFPTIDAKSCTGCQLCVDFCFKRVFALTEGKASVAQPYECVVLCSGCIPKCPQQAISFPNREDFEQFVAYDE